jgi:hypothetical protein
MNLGAIVGFAPRNRMQKPRENLGLGPPACGVTHPEANAPPVGRRDPLAHHQKS